MGQPRAGGGELGGILVRKVGLRVRLENWAFRMQGAGNPQANCVMRCLKPFGYIVREGFFIPCRGFAYQLGSCLL